MKQMKQKILIPFLLVVLIIPLISLLSFNIAFRIYIDRNTRKELIQTADTMKALVKKELVVSIYNPEENELDNAFKNISSALFVSKLAGSTEILLFNSSFELIYPKKTEMFSISPELAKKISNYLQSSKKGTAKLLRSNREKLTVLGYRLTELPISESPYVVFAVSSSRPNDLIRQVNIILGIVLLLGIIISVIIASYVSAKLSKPLFQLSETTSKIGSGNFIEAESSSDITEISALYQSVNLMSKMLREYDKAQKSFLQDASHELRTPLTVIQGFAEGIENDVIPDTKKAAGIISSESKKLGTLVDELLTLSRIENNAYARELETLKLEDNLREYHQSLSIAAKNSDKELLLSMPEEISFPVLANDLLLSRAVSNIVVNCLRYAKSRVEISLSKLEDKAIIRISDDGDGIDKEDLPFLFDRFYKGKNGNFGLGLAIVKSAVVYMGGSVEAHNLCPGAEFVVILPLIMK